MKSKRAQEAVAIAEDKPANIHQDAEPTTKKRKRGGDDEVEDSGKKAKKDKKKKKGEKESRKEKKDKRKNLQDLPEVDDESDAAANGEVSSQAAAPAEETKKDRKSKKEKKEKKEKKDGEDVKLEEAPKKKAKKDKKTASSTDETTTVAPEDAIPNGASNGIDLDVEANGDGDAEEGKPEKAARHIVFVGNLPYTATAASISAHFASLSPIAVRCLTNKGDSKNTCKGIAFVEFGHVSAQRTCLDKFHHSMFDDGKSEARKINVELSAGGGGKGGNRSEKIRQKNIKLDENRAKRIEKEKTGKTSTTEGGGGSKGDSGTVEEQQEHMDEQIHPSRRAQMGSDAPAENDLNGGGGYSGGGRGRGGWGGRGRGGGGGRGRGGRGGGRGRGGWGR